MTQSNRTSPAPIAALAGAWLLLAALVVPVASAAPGKIDQAVLGKFDQQPNVSVLVRLAEPAAPPAAAGGADFAAKVGAAAGRHQRHAAQSQRPLRADLDQRGVRYRTFWLVNAIALEGSSALLHDLALRTDVVAIEPNWAVQMRPPQPESDPAAASPLLGPFAATAVTWGVADVGAPKLWAQGITGAGVVVAGQDTGYQWDHPALIASYRGWNGSVADHVYSWFDAISTDLGPTGANPCGFLSPAPCDDDSHGTHTIGTVVGSASGEQIGVAPGARWIGCRNMENGWGVPSTYLACFEFFVAPTDLAGLNPRPDLAPHVINNSWGCPPSEGCAQDTLALAVANVRAAGILVVASAGNSGSGCASVIDPPAIYPESFGVGAYGSGGAIASFSSRGPVTIGAQTWLKPDIAAPGVGVRSSVPGSGYGSKSGTSMAGPHVAGVAALLLSAVPELRGQPALVEQLLRASARPATSNQSCGAFAGGAVPNAVFGHGRIDARAAVALALARDGLFNNGFE